MDLTKLKSHDNKIDSSCECLNQNKDFLINLNFNHINQLEDTKEQEEKKEPYLVPTQEHHINDLPNNIKLVEEPIDNLLINDNHDCDQSPRRDRNGRRILKGKGEDHHISFIDMLNENYENYDLVEEIQIKSIKKYNQCFSYNENNKNGGNCCCFIY